MAASAHRAPEEALGVALLELASGPGDEPPTGHGRLATPHAKDYVLLRLFAIEEAVRRFPAAREGIRMVVQAGVSVAIEDAARGTGDPQGSLGSLADRFARYRGLLDDEAPPWGRRAMALVGAVVAEGYEPAERPAITQAAGEVFAQTFAAADALLRRKMQASASSEPWP